MKTNHSIVEWRKTISPARDRMQSDVLVGLIVSLLAWGTFAAYWPFSSTPLPSLRPLVFPLLFSFGFAALVWALRSATLPAAGVGLLVCLILARPSAGPGGLRALIVLFGLTFAATRLGRAGKERKGLAETKSGRRASQVAANLGAAALCAAVGFHAGSIAALAEAAADTVSSEVGQALGGPTWLLTTLRRVPTGRDGGVSLSGTLAGATAAGLVVWAGGPASVFWLVFAAACAGLVFDSLLGATVEQRGWLGNDLVNFGSTLFAAVLAYAFMIWRRGGM